MGGRQNDMTQQAGDMQTISSLGTINKPSHEAVSKAQQTKQAYSSWVGETFYSQMLSSMRSTVGKPAYFHGGQAEEKFRAQLDMQLAQSLAESTGDRFAEPMFEQAFPQEAEVLKQAEAADMSIPLQRLSQLSEIRY